MFYSLDKKTKIIDKRDKIRLINLYISILKIHFYLLLIII